MGILVAVVSSLVAVAVVARAASQSVHLADALQTGESCRLSMAVHVGLTRDLI